MLITRLCDTTEHSHWPCDHYNRPPSRPQSPRMSEKQSLPPPVEPEWQGQYSHLSHMENDIYQRASTDARNHLDGSRAKSTMSVGQHAKSQGFKREADNEQLGHMITGPGLQRNRSTSSIFSAQHASSKVLDPTSRDNIGTETFPYTRLIETHGLYRSHGDQASGTELSQSDRDEKEQSLSQDADFDMEDDEADDGDGDGQSHRQTVAERLAARRKMKRFRLSHQQTRFLMSEFAKQPHPDAGHRERLSQEIPGLSPRQVQVWFQNRRAKIKRLTADDRDRMIRMRAVPDDFDNVQALHSPYGAVHGIGTSLSPSTLGPMASSYGNHGVRSSLADMRRPGGEPYMSPTGLSHSFGGIDLGQSGAMANSDLTSSSSSLYHDRYMPGVASASTSGVPYRTSTTYWNPTTGNMDNASHLSRSGMRDIHSLQARDWSSRQAPDVNMYSGGVTPISNAPNRQVAYPTTSGFGSFEPHNYSSHSNLAGRAGGNATEIEGSSQGRIRSPSVSTPAPMTMDFGFRDHFRATGLTTSSSQLHEKPQGLPSLKSDSSSSPTSYTPGPPSAPLDMSPQQPFRMQNDRVRDYSSSQLSTPISAPTEFNRSFHVPTPNRNTSSGPLKDLIGHGVL